MRTRAEEYLRRMKALGYEPSLAGMDEEDFDYELARMGQIRREDRPPAQQTVYRPVDPGLAARILRQMGQPFDPNAIVPRESFYIGGWDDGGEEGEAKSLVPRSKERNSSIGDADFDPWENVWRPDWGKDGNILAGPRTMEYRPGREGAMFPSREAIIRPLSYASGGTDVDTGGQSTGEAGTNPYAGGYADGGAEGDMLFGVTGVTPLTLNKRTGFSGYLNKLGEAESRGSGDYQAKNEDGYLGRYQMGAAALGDAGFYNYGDGENSEVNKYNGTWRDKAKAYGVTSGEDFLKSPEAQEAAIREYNKKIWGYIRDGGYDKYIGQKIHGVEVTAS